MSGIRRLPQISLLLGAATASIAVACKESTRDRIARALGINASGGLWRLVAVLLALLNLKNLPFVWHYRLFRSLIYHLFLQPTEIKPQDLFRPVIQTMHTPISEMDYNFHKSNSTYFTDLDIARTHLATAILRKGIRGVKNGGNETFSFRNTARAAGHKSSNDNSALGTIGQAAGSTGGRMTADEWYEQVTRPGPLLVALGAVSCNFHREIKPYRRYEIWTRLLTWDRKWLYIVSHFVEEGIFKPRSYSLQPGRKGGRKVENLSNEDKARLKHKIFASSVAKYVVKKGRLTIPPELVLERCQMLPARPVGTPILGGWTPGNSVGDSPGRTAIPSPAPQAKWGDHTRRNGNAGPGSDILGESIFPNEFKPEVDGSDGSDGWTWNYVQEQRLKGLRLANAFDTLDALRDVFSIESEDAMGMYTDLILNF